MTAHPDWSPEVLRETAVEAINSDPNADDNPLRVLIPGDGMEPAPEQLWRAVEEAIGKKIRKPLKYSDGFEQPNVALCRALLKRWAHIQALSTDRKETA